MDFQQLIDSIDPDTYEKLKRAVEIGKWANGTPLTPKQREHCLQAVIAYDQKHRPAQQRVGYVHTKQHDHCGGEGAVAEPDTIKWRK